MKNKKKISWEEEFDAAITIVDGEGCIIYMNKKAIETFASDGGKKLIGKKLQECHQPASMEIIQQMMSGQHCNTYTIEKKGIKKFIHQAPWFHNGVCIGIVEMSIVLPPDMPHHVRE